MSFFKKYNGTSNRRLARMETLIWVLIYGGLLSVVVSLFMSDDGQDLAMVLRILGGIVVAAGVVLIVVRSRMREEH